MKLFSWKNPLLWYGSYQKDFLPIYIKTIKLGLKLNTPFFFSAANPSMNMGGLVSSKMAILNQIPSKNIPKTILIQKSSHGNQQYLLKILKQNNLVFPLFAKPDIGERGWNARKINTISELIAYLKSTKQDTVIQEYINKKHEYNVHYYRFPNEKNGQITSLSEKIFLSVTGNGQNTLIDLIKKDVEILKFVNTEMYKEEFPKRANMIIPKGELVQISSTGSRGYGVIYKDLRHLINPILIKTYDNLSKDINGFYYGRYDIKAESFNDLETGKNIEIIELNGVFGCPNHAWSPMFTSAERKKTLIEHWDIVCKISIQNHQINKVPYMPFKTGIKQLFKYIFFKK